jgi:hypothetical protein
MECVTIKPGTHCLFMKKTGCFNGGACHPIVEDCEGCGYVMENAQGRYCQLSLIQQPNGSSDGAISPPM